MLWSIQWSGTILQYSTSQFLCDLILCWCVLHNPDMTQTDMTGYTLDCTAGSWSQQDKFILPRHLFSHLGFPDSPCCLGCNMCSRLVMTWYWIVDWVMMIDWRMTDGCFLGFTVTLSSIDVCYMRRIWPRRVWLVILWIPRRVHGHSRRCLLFLGTYSHTWVFPGVRVVLSVTFILGFVIIMD